MSDTTKEIKMKTIMNSTIELASDQIVSVEIDNYAGETQVKLTKKEGGGYMNFTKDEFLQICKMLHAFESTQS